MMIRIIAISAVRPCCSARTADVSAQESAVFIVGV